MVERTLRKGAHSQYCHKAKIGLGPTDSLIYKLYWQGSSMGVSWTCWERVRTSWWGKRSSQKRFRRVQKLLQQRKLRVMHNWRKPERIERIERRLNTNKISIVISVSSKKRPDQLPQVWVHVWYKICRRYFHLHFGANSDCCIFRQNSVRHLS